MWRLAYYPTEEDADTGNEEKEVLPYSVRYKTLEEMETLTKMLEDTGFNCCFHREKMRSLLINTTFMTWAVYPKRVHLPRVDDRTYTTQEFIDEVLTPIKQRKMKEKTPPKAFKPRLYPAGRRQEIRMEIILNHGGTAYVYLGEGRDLFFYDMVVKVYRNKEGDWVAYCKERGGGQQMISESETELLRDTFSCGIAITEDEYEVF